MKHFRLLLLIALLSAALYPYHVQAEESAQWTTKKPMEERLISMGVVTAGEAMYRFGGYNASSGLSSNKLYRYDLENDLWIPLANMNNKRHNFATTVFDGKIYVFGGTQNLGTSPFPIINTVEEYDPATDVWTVKANMPTARMGMMAATINGKIYVIGGVTGANNTLTPVVEEYDPTTNTWTKKKDLPIPKWSYGLGVYRDNVYVLGGYTSGNIKTNSIEVYNSLADSWTTSNTVVPSSINRPLSVTYKDSFYLFNTTTSYIFSPSTDTWTTFPVETPRIDTGAAGIVNGSIFLMGVSYSPSVVEYKIGDHSNPNPEPEPEPSSSRAILTVTLVNGLVKEYDLPTEEVNSFVNWYDAKDAGTGPSKFSINKHSNNKGPYKKRTDYVVFDKILTFSVDEYTAE